MKRTLKNAIATMDNESRKEAANKLRDIINEIDKYAGSYFWTPSKYASARRQRAFETDIEVKLGDETITFKSDYYESCQNCYYTKSLLYNGNRTTKTLLKNIITALEDSNLNETPNPQMVF